MGKFNFREWIKTFARCEVSGMGGPGGIPSGQSRGLEVACLPTGPGTWDLERRQPGVGPGLPGVGGRPAWSHSLYCHCPHLQEQLLDKPPLPHPLTVPTSLWLLPDQGFVLPPSRLERWGMEQRRSQRTLTWEPGPQPCGSCPI